ncbi:MAG TPA: signal peptidase I [Candidatus Woesebacteria bacterium]|nr:signal peptidase I [Candidatus Woesebacteria bacterium]
MPFLRKLYTILIDLFETLVIAGGIFVVIYAFLFRPYQVNGESMIPNFHNGEYVLTNLITLRLGDVEKGEVIVFKAPSNHDKDYIKRVIATAGDTVMIRDGKVYVNSQLVDEREYLPSTFSTSNGNFIKPGDIISVPEDRFFVLGDNRNASSDSREWGFVRRDEIVGKSMLVYWPPSEFRFIHAAQYGN